MAQKIFVTHGPRPQARTASDAEFALYQQRRRSLATNQAAWHRQNDAARCGCGQLTDWQPMPDAPADLPPPLCARCAGQAQVLGAANAGLMANSAGAEWRAYDPDAPGGIGDAAPVMANVGQPAEWIEYDSDPGAAPRPIAANAGPRWAQDLVTRIRRNGERIEQLSEQIYADDWEAYGNE